MPPAGSMNYPARTAERGGLDLQHSDPIFQPSLTGEPLTSAEQSRSHGQVAQAVGAGIPQATWRPMAPRGAIQSFMRRAGSDATDNAGVAKAFAWVFLDQ